MRYEKLKKIAMDLEEVYMTTKLGGEDTVQHVARVLIPVPESLS